MGLGSWGQGGWGRGVGLYVSPAVWRIFFLANLLWRIFHVANPLATGTDCGNTFQHIPVHLVAIMTSFTNQTRTIFAVRILHCTDRQIQNSLLFINTTLHQQFLISISKSTKNMSKQQFPNFFLIILVIQLYTGI